jgi:hypothetical protein
MGGNMLHIVEAFLQNYLQAERILCLIQGNVSMSRTTLNRKRATTVKKGIPSLVSSRAVPRRMTGVQATANEETFSGQCELKNTLREKPHYFSIILIIDTPKSIFFFIFFNVNNDNY